MLCLFGTCWVIDRLDLPLAHILELDKTRSNLEGKSYAKFPAFSEKGFWSTEYQDEIETFISDRMPLRDTLLMANASWQRQLIKVSSSIHGFTVYPTFFGSDYCYDEENDALYQTLEYADPRVDEQYEVSAQAFSLFATSHPNINFYFYRIDRLSSSSNNPTNRLQKGVVNTDYLSEHFFDRLEGIKVIDGIQRNQQESLDVFFRSDHHWTGPGAYEAYVDILSVMQPTTLPVSELTQVSYEHPSFYGSCSRASLCLVREPDHIDDYLFDMSSYTIYVDGQLVEPESLQHTQLYQSGLWSRDLFMNRYSEYWHGDFPTLRIDNKNAETDETLLIIRDSYSAPLERYFAQTYQSVLTLDPRYSSSTVDELISENSVDDVLVLMGSTTFSTDETVASLN